MEKPSEIQINEFTRQTLLEWAKRLEKVLKASLSKNNLNDTQNLVNSIRAELMGSDDKQGVKLSFATYGRVLEVIGAKNGSNFKSNGLTKKQKQANGRPKLTKSRSRWYTRKRSGMILQLTELLVTDYAAVIAASAKQTIVQNQ